MNRVALTSMGLAMMVVTLAARSAHGQDLAPPSFRGASLSTFGEWDFSGGAGGGAPDVQFANPYGTPHWSTSGDATWEAVGPTTSSGLPPRGDVWEIKKGGGGTVSNSNTAVAFTASIGCKQADIAMMYFGDAPVVSIDPIAGAGDFTCQLDEVVTIPQADGWTFARYDFTLFASTSPSAENLDILAAPNGDTFLDSVVIDTVVVPEPGSLALLAVFGGAMINRRRRSIKN